MTILDKIVKDKIEELYYIKKSISYRNLESSNYFCRDTVSMKQSVTDKNLNGIISEFKRQSPSKGVINDFSKVQDVTFGYENAKVSAISILTNKKYFGGTNDDIINSRDGVNIPILRKEFIIDEYQIVEAKSIGADAILLIASILDKKKIKQFSELAKSLNLDVLFEIHNENELKKVHYSVDMVGVNNRNLNDFTVDIKNSKDLSKIIPNDFVKVSESGISNTEAIKDLINFGYKGFLIGENFMKTKTPAEECSKFIEELNVTI